jgi:hypothetical protein
LASSAPPQVTAGGCTSFDTVVDDALAADDHVIARLTKTAVPKATGKKVVFQNLGLFGVAAGRVISSQLYAETAATTSGAPVLSGQHRFDAVRPG